MATWTRALATPSIEAIVLSSSCERPYAFLGRRRDEPLATEQFAQARAPLAGQAGVRHQAQGPPELGLLHHHVEPLLADRDLLGVDAVRQQQRDGLVRVVLDGAGDDVRLAAGNEQRRNEARRADRVRPPRARTQRPLSPASA